MSELYCFEPQPQVSVPIIGSDQRFPVHRIFCVGRNYHAHAAEMGVTVDKSTAQPFYFNKHPSAIVETGSTLAYPPETANYHYEMELVVALGSGGFRLGAEQADELILGYAAGLDMTRRDLQQRAKDSAHPWDLGKDFEQAAVIGPIRRKAETGLIQTGTISLSVNGDVRQQSSLDLMIWTVAELIADLSRYYVLMPGDLIYTGTPEGVGPVTPGDQLSGSIEGVGEISCTIGDARVSAHKERP
ncbi:MAG: fumarylacetoacetate hydrolase family protein [Pseudomonadales bacterium]